MKERLERHNIKVDKVITTKQIRERYTTPKQQLVLVTQYDLFLMENQTCYMIPELFTPHFMSRRLIVSIDCSEKGIEESITQAIKGVDIRPRRSKDGGMIVGLMSQTDEEVAENILAVLDGLEKVIDFGSENFFSIFVKSINGISLPLFTAI